jgi:hypothetical protein
VFFHFDGFIYGYSAVEVHVEQGYVTCDCRVDIFVGTTEEGKKMLKTERYSIMVKYSAFQCYMISSVTEKHEENSPNHALTSPP